MLAEHAPELRVHTVLADRGSVGDDLAELQHLVTASGADLVVDDLAALLTPSDAAGTPGTPGTPAHPQPHEHESTQP